MPPSVQKIVSYFLSFSFVIQCSRAYYPFDDIVKSVDEYPLPKLNHKYKDYEPHIDEKTMQVHHNGHHAAYTRKMNAALNEWRASVSLSPLSITFITYS